MGGHLQKGLYSVVCAGDSIFILASSSWQRGVLISLFASCCDTLRGLCLTQKAAEDEEMLVVTVCARVYCSTDTHMIDWTDKS